MREKLVRYCGAGSTTVGGRRFLCPTMAKTGAEDLLKLRVHSQACERLLSKVTIAAEPREKLVRRRAEQSTGKSLVRIYPSLIWLMFNSIWRYNNTLRHFSRNSHPSGSGIMSCCVSCSQTAAGRRPPSCQERANMTQLEYNIQRYKRVKDPKLVNR